MEALYDYLLKNFEPNKPIFLSDVKTSGINYANIRKQMKNLVDSGKIKRFDSGIYFLTTKTIFKSGSELSPDDVLEYKYLLSDNKRCGYISGLMFWLSVKSCGWSSNVRVVSALTFWWFSYFKSCAFAPPLMWFCST